MVYFSHPDTQPSGVEDSTAEDYLETKEIAPEGGATSSSSCVIISQGHSKRVDVSVHRSVAGHTTTRLDVSISRSLTETPAIFDIGRSCPLSGQIPVRGMTSLRSLFDLAGPAACNTNYSHGREIGGKSGVLALQVPASSLPPRLSASVVTESVQMTSSGAFFPSLESSDSRLMNTLPPTTPNAECIHYDAESDLPSLQLREGEGGGGSGDAADVQVSANSEDTTMRPKASSTRIQGEIVRRLSEVLQGRQDGDLVLQREDRDDMMLQWLQALDHHVVGACRADERLRPMLRWNVSCSGADGRLLAQLSQHFRARELGMLARCLCAPLVSIRVGKVELQGRLLRPTTARGYLSLIMLPSSEMRLSFVGDNGSVDRIAILRPGSDLSPILEILPPDTSGRTFVIKLSSRRHHFWQSERSKDSGDKLLSKMKDLLKQRPTLAQLTGVHESRLDSFVCQLRSALHVTSSSTVPGHSSVPAISSSGTPSTTEVNTATCSSSIGTPALASSIRQSQRFSWNRSLTARVANSQPSVHGRTHCGSQGSLSPRASGFKDGSIKVSTSVKSIISSREKHKRRIEMPIPTSSITVPSGSRNSKFHSNDNINDILNTSLNTQMALTVSDNERTDIVTHSAGLYTSLPPVSCALGQYSCTRECIISNPKQLFNLPFPSSACSAPQSLLPSILGGFTSNPNSSHPAAVSQMSLQLFNLPFPSSACSASQSLLPSIVGGFTSNPSSSHPAAVSQMSISSSTVLAPYYCPCPLRSSALQYTITPPFLPSLSETSVLPPSSSLFSVRPAPTLLSQTSISLDRVSISPIPLPVSSLVNLPTPLQASSLPLFFSDPIVHIPVINLQSGILVSAPPALSSSGRASVLPSFLSSVLPGLESQVGRQEFPVLNNFQVLGISPPWDNLGNQGKTIHDMDSFLMDAGSRSLFNSATEARLARTAEKENAVVGFSGILEGSSSSGEAILPPFNVRCGAKTVGSSYDNLVHYEASPKLSGPLMGMVPAMLTSGSLSCVLNFSQGRPTKSTAWVSGSRGLYGGACEPGIPSATPLGISSLLKACDRGVSTCWTPKGDVFTSENLEAMLPSNSSSYVEDDQGPEENHKNRFSAA